MVKYLNKELKIGPFKTSKIEIKDILFSWLGITIAFSFVITQSRFSSEFIAALIIAAFTVGIGFIFHELAHKIVAQHYGCTAEFRSFRSMIYFAVILAVLFRVIFAAPGAVFISGPVGIRRNGKISIAGPAANLALSVLFFISHIYYQTGFLGDLSLYGYIINAWLALFNMIPFLNLDGKKVLLWSKPVYFTTVAIALTLLNLKYIFGA